MLESKKTKLRQCRRFRMAENAKDTAFLTKFVENKFHLFYFAILRRLSQRTIYQGQMSASGGKIDISVDIKGQFFGMREMAVFVRFYDTAIQSIKDRV